MKAKKPNRLDISMIVVVLESEMVKCSMPGPENRAEREREAKLKLPLEEDPKT